MQNSGDEQRIDDYLFADVPRASTVDVRNTFRRIDDYLFAESPRTSAVDARNTDWGIDRYILAESPRDSTVDTRNTDWRFDGNFGESPRASTVDARNTDWRIAISNHRRSREEITYVAKKQIEVPAVIGRDDEEYNMKHPRRGAALIFNHQKFERMASRIGTEKDVAALIETFEKLGFEPRIYVDVTYQKLFNILENTAKEDHGDCDCLVVTVMSHGDPGYIHCYDTLYPTEKLWEPFTSDNCPSLAGKPKLFFIQACRGRRCDVGVRMKMSSTQVDSVRAWYTLPACADILIAHSTAEGYVAWIDPDRGSWFIQILCEELDKHGRTRDLLTILTWVCRRVATEFLSSVPEDVHKDLMKQVPAFTSMLTRQVFFR